MSDPSSALTGVVIGLVSSFGSILLIGLVVFVFWASGCAGSGRILLDRLGRPGEYDDEQAFLREEEEALETMDEMARTDYLRAKAFVTANPPESLQTDISLSQYLAIQEKGVSAWEFEPELEIANCFVEGRTEIEFYDSECTVMCNLPVPKQNDVYYWEAKIYEKPESTLLGIGMATKPYPLFRLPGYHKYSVAYHSNGSRHYNQPFSHTPYGPRLVQGDVVGVGYRPRTGAIFFTRNGKKLEEVVHGLKSQNFFPAIGANGPATVHVNLGQSGFVFIEANVKKWGLAPVTGSLAPPPPYGSEQGSILLESGTKDGYTPSPGRRHGHSFSGSILFALTRAGETSSSAQQQQQQQQQSEEEHQTENPLHLHLLDATNPPPDYTSPTGSDSEGSSRRNSTDSDDTPLIQVMNRSRSNSTAAPGTTTNDPPVPSYRDAIEQGAGQHRRNSSDSERSASDTAGDDESESSSDDSTNTVTPLSHNPPSET
ncbi:endosomal SPRY domain protein [Akanthomyces lecanii RCEF 1005]|uniref:Protein SSH4 n=1 Tax=Akanthomyces lecanii RCEF 1005 TaxID=1081108 RepID=A0A162K3P3_CORDF|nr:endosomal SPRY domain protein [Akanthomyces lecanii RCEF 1005]